MMHPRNDHFSWETNKSKKSRERKRREGPKKSRNKNKHLRPFLKDCNGSSHETFDSACVYHQTFYRRTTPELWRSAGIELKNCVIFFSAIDGTGIRIQRPQVKPPSFLFISSKVSFLSDSDIISSST